MNLISANIPADWAVGLWLLSGLLFVLMARRAAWGMLKNPNNLNVLLGACVAILGLWLIKAGIKPGLNFHLLGATVLTLMFRPWFALFVLALVIAALTLQNGEFNAYPANLFIMGVVPVTVSWAIYRLVDGHLPNHMFIYIFLNGFFGAAIASATVGLASTLFAAVGGSYPLSYLLDQYLPYYMLMAWAEAFSTGMAMTLMVVYRPGWVATFDDRRYLQSK